MLFLAIKLRHCEKATLFEKKTPTCFDVYLVISKQFLWPFQKIRTLPKTPQPQKSYWAELKTPLFRISCYTKVIPIVARAHYWLAGWGYSFHQQFHSQSHLDISHAVSKIWDLGWPAVLKIYVTLIFSKVSFWNTKLEFLYIL